LRNCTKGVLSLRRKKEVEEREEREEDGRQEREEEGRQKKKQKYEKEKMRREKERGNQPQRCKRRYMMMAMATFKGKEGSCTSATATWSMTGASLPPPPPRNLAKQEEEEEEEEEEEDTRFRWMV